MSLKERTEDEWRRLLASMRVAGAPDPAPHRTVPVRRAIQAAWDELQGCGRADRVATARAMRGATAEDRGYVNSLLRGTR